MKFFKRPVIIILLLLILSGAGTYAYRLNAHPVQAEEIMVTRGSIIQEVGVTGQVMPLSQADLAFERGGKVANVHAQVGTQVTQGQPLVTLVNDELIAQLHQAQASVQGAHASLQQNVAALQAAQVRLDEIIQGTRPEELEVARLAVLNAQRGVEDAQRALDQAKVKGELDLANLYTEVKNVLTDVYVKADDAITRQIDELFTNDTSTSPQLSFPVAPLQVEVDVEFGRFVAGETLTQLRTEAFALGIDEASRDRALVNTHMRLNSLIVFLDRVGDALTAHINLPQATLTTYRTNVATARANLNTAIASITNQQKLIAAQRASNQSSLISVQASLTNVQNALITAQSQYELKKAGSTPQAIAAGRAQVRQAQANVAFQQAQISQAQANVQNIQAQLAKTSIVAPFGGVVTVQEAKVGEIVAANTTVVSLVAQSAMEVQANIPEVDAGKVMVGNPVAIFIDALPGESFSGQVFHIDPAPTIVDGVISFKIRISLQSQDPRIKNGLTANVKVQTLRKENALLLPQVAILENDEGTFVRKRQGQNTQEVKVQTGIRGEDGNVEIISGVSEGESVQNVGLKTTE